MAVLIAASVSFLFLSDEKLFTMVAVSCVVNFALAKVVSKRPKLLLPSIGLNVVALYFVERAEIFSGPFAFFPMAFLLLSVANYLIEAADDPVGRSRDSVAEFVLYLIFFPKVLAGPIERPHAFIGASRSPEPRASVDYSKALLLIAFGLFKKGVVADRVGAFIHPFFADPERYANQPLFAWACTLLTYVYIYFSLSGYTDIARGAALGFGVRLSENFDRPFAASSPSDFWRRNHVSVSSWFKDFVFIPGALMFEGKVARVLVLVATFAICGLWHRMTPNFLVWGLFSGMLVLGVHVVQTWAPKFRLPSAVTLGLISVSCIFVFAQSLGDAVLVFGALVSFGSFGSVEPLTIVSPGWGLRDAVIVIAAVLALLAIEPRSSSEGGRKSTRWLIAAMAFIAWSLLKHQPQRIFNYLNF
ncbi:MAG: MBOAT family O-acyltransferase [Bdellovibrionota bacterium]